MSAWWPPGHVIGYEHSFTHQMRDFIAAIASGQDPEPSFADALQVQQVLDAVIQSTENGSVWTRVAEAADEAAPGAQPAGGSASPGTQPAAGADGLRASTGTE